MKKFFTLLSVLAATALTAEAQTVVFSQADGTVIPSGTTLTINQAEIDPDFGDVTLESGVFIKNTGSKDKETTLDVNVSEITGVSPMIACCLGTNCRNYTAVGTYSITATLFGNSNNSAMLHASTSENKYFSATMVLTIKESVTKKTSITVKFVYSDTSSLDAVEENSQAVKYYDLLGRETTVLKGVLIEKKANGQCRKVRF